MKIEHYKPGDMTRYDFGLDGRLFVWLNGRAGGVCVVLPDVQPNADWLAEKLRCSDHDAAVVERWLHYNYVWWKSKVLDGDDLTRPAGFESDREYD